MDDDCISGCSTVDIHQLCPAPSVVATRICTKTSWQRSWGKTIASIGWALHAQDANLGGFSKFPCPWEVAWKVFRTRSGSIWSFETERCGAVYGVWWTSCAWRNARPWQIQKSCTAFVCPSRITCDPNQPLPWDPSEGQCALDKCWSTAQTQKFWYKAYFETDREILGKVLLHRYICDAK